MVLDDIEDENIKSDFVFCIFKSENEGFKTPNQDFPVKIILAKKKNCSCE